MTAGTPYPYDSLHAEIERLLREDPDFEREVAETARGFGPPPDPGDMVIDDSGYHTSKEVDRLLAAGRIREAAALTAGKLRADSMAATGTTSLSVYTVPASTPARRRKNYSARKQQTAAE